MIKRNLFVIFYNINFYIDYITTSLFIKIYKLKYK